MSGCVQNHQTGLLQCCARAFAVFSHFGSLVVQVPSELHLVLQRIQSAPKTKEKQPQGRVNHYIWIFRTVTITLQISCRSMENKNAQHFEDVHSHH